MRIQAIMAICLMAGYFSIARAQAPRYELRNFLVSIPHDIITGDFNNDGFLDIAISDGDVGPGFQHNQQTLLNDGAGNFTWVITSTLAPSALHNELVAGFFDADNMLDIVKPIGANVPGRGAVIPLQGQGDGTFQFLGFFYDTDTDWPNWITAADFDKDGNLDVAVSAIIMGALGSDLVSVLLGDGNLGFAAADTFFVGAAPRDIIADDFDGDTNPDLAVVLSGEDSVAVLLGVGDGTFQMPPFKYAVADSPVTVISGFLDGDTNKDLAVVNNISESVSVLLGLGTGQFSVVASTFPTGTNPVSIAEGPLGGNGAHDLAVANRGSDDVTLLIGSGDGNFNTSYTYGVAPGPQGITAGDFNGDALLDLAVSCNVGDSVSVLLRLTSPATGIDDGQPPPAYRLSGISPNPFNPTTTIRYDVPPPGGHVTIMIFDTAGRRVRRLVNGVQPAGSNNVVWDGRDDRRVSASTGVYFVRMTADQFTATRKIVLLK